MVFIEQFGKPQLYKINLKNCERTILQLISSTPYNGWDLGVQFANADYIRDLNSRYRGKDKATDILSFGFHQVNILYCL
jgi:ssRNA-specific RNase YbeY (16S rRNA maturation enzyme)